MKDVVAIDLGNAYSNLSIYHGGHVETVKNYYSQMTSEESCYKIENIIGFQPKQRTFGSQAKKQNISNARNTIYDIKYLLGRDYDDPIILTRRNQWPFKIVNHLNRLKVNIQFKEGEFKFKFKTLTNET
jgi:molecular chaperone DnaK (HSP70)